MEDESKNVDELQDFHLLSREDQELVLMEDLLCTLRGISGAYITVNPSEGLSTVCFQTVHIQDSALNALVGRMIPICEAHSKVQSFVSLRLELSQGLVSHAFAAAIRSILQEFEVHVSQMDDDLRMGQLSLSSLWFHFQSLQRTFDMLAVIVDEAEAQKLAGVDLLNLLRKESIRRGGEQMIKSLLERLWRQSFIPYALILERWICHGVIDDPYNEFMVQEAENSSHARDALFWEQQYTLRQSAMPDFLAPLDQQVLTVGKYINAIRLCGKTFQVELADKTGFSDTPSQAVIIDKIQECCELASKELLSVIVNDYQLVGRLQSLKHCFLFDQSDFVRDFMHTSSAELDKWSASVSKEKLTTLLDLAVKSSVCVSDPFHEDITCTLQKKSLAALMKGWQEQDGADMAGMDGWGAFAMDYRVPWPLSLVVSHKALATYQALSRHLFQCMHVLRQLSAAWQAHQTLRCLPVQQSTLQQSHLLCQRMLHFIEHVLHFTTIEVIDPKWHSMEASVRTSTTVDQVVAHHDSFLADCLRYSHLLDLSFVQELAVMKAACLDYSAVALRMVSDLTSRIQQSRGSIHGGRVAPAPHFVDKLRKLEGSFVSGLVSLISTLSNKSLSEPFVEDLVRRLQAAGQGLVGFEPKLIGQI